MVFLLCCCFSWETGNTLSLLSLLISILTLTLGYMAYKKFLVKQAQQKQLDIVLALANQIHNDKNGFSVISSKELDFQHIDPVSLFDIINERDFTSNNKLYFIVRSQLPIVAGDGVTPLLNWDFYHKFHKEPLLPKSIAEKVKAFDINKNYTPLRFDATTDSPCILLGNRIPQDVIEVRNFPFSKLEHADAFREAVIELKQSILSWLKSYGIEDINLFES